MQYRFGKPRDHSDIGFPTPVEPYVFDVFFYDPLKRSMLNSLLPHLFYLVGPFGKPMDG
jgi:hypothetical protein